LSQETNILSEDFPQWMKDPSVSEIPMEKLHFLNQIHQKSQGKDQKQLLQILLPLLKEAKEKHLTLTPAELQLSIAAIKKYSSEEELQKIDTIMKTGNRA